LPIELRSHHPSEHRLQVGDVVMITRPLKDKVTGKPFEWKYFAMVTKLARRNDSVFQHIILDEKEREPTMFYRTDFTETGLRIWYLHPDEWPDGVHAFRTKLILEGRIEGLI
jgi:hypothetical protein